ncbi:MAG: transposase [Lachnospiraceae bacterium]|nr:transposase [Lachnospiraceae bacterium]
MKEGEKAIGYQKRIWYPGACYHVMSRGVRGGKIFQDENDYRLFLEIIRMYQEKYGFIIHSYCLMTNHFHLQIETNNVALGTIMERILKAYANNFNIKYHYEGHVFQGRYKGIIIEDSIYFLETGRYIHLNPVKAKMVMKPENYEYSSYQSYISLSENELLYKDKTLSFFRDSDPVEYAKFVEAKVTHEEYELSIRTELGENDNWLPW